MHRFALFLACSVLAACASLQPTAVGPTAGGGACKTAETRAWDLGTGTAADIRRVAPEFYGFRAPGWHAPLQPLLMDDARRSRVSLDAKNRERVQAIRHGKPGGVQLRSTHADDVEVYDLVPAEPRHDATVRAFPLMDKLVIVMVMPGHCPHVTATDSCDSGDMRTDLKVDGSVACVGPYSLTDDHVWLSIRGSSPKEFQFGEPAAFKPEALGVALGNGKNRVRPQASLDVAIRLSEADRPAWQGTVRLGDFSDPTPDEVIAYLKAEHYEAAAAAAYQQLDADARTEAFKTTVADARIRATKSSVDKATAANEVLALLRTHAMGAGLPGDEGVSDLIRPKLRDALRGVAQQDEPTEEEFTLGSLLLMAFRHWAPGEDVSAEEKAFDERYGPLISSGKLGDEKDQRVFVSLFPGSSYTAQIQSRLQKDRAEAAKRDASAQFDPLWEDVVAQGDEIARNRYRIAFAKKYLAPSRRTALGIQNMEGYTRGLVDQAFCPAKKAFIKAAGTTEFQKRAREHCEDEAPTGNGMGGVEVTLKPQCTAAYATGCP